MLTVEWNWNESEEDIKYQSRWRSLYYGGEDDHRGLVVGQGLKALWLDGARPWWVIIAVCFRWGKKNNNNKMRKGWEGRLCEAENGAANSAIGYWDKGTHLGSFMLAKNIEQTSGELSLGNFNEPMSFVWIFHDKWLQHELSANMIESITPQFSTWQIDCVESIFHMARKSEVNMKCINHCRWTMHKWWWITELCKTVESRLIFQRFSPSYLNLAQWNFD